MNELIHIRIDKTVKTQMQRIVKQHAFSTVSEFVKESIRKNIAAYKQQEALHLLAKNFGNLPAKQLTAQMKKDAVRALNKSKRDVLKDYDLAEHQE